MALQHIGCCGTEADLIMSFLNMPNGSGMKSNTFHRIENNIGDIVREITQEECRNALEQEVFLTLQREEDFDKWKNGKQVSEIKICICYDMGWNKRSSGNRYDSNSGHAFAVGTLTKELITFRVLSKTCRVCQFSAKNKK